MRRLLALLVLLAAGCTAEPATDPVAGPASAPVTAPTSPPSSWQVELGTAPTLMVLTVDDVYAASFGNGVGGSQVYRVDRSTGTRVAQRTLAGEPNAMAIGPTGELWLATVRLPDQVAGTGVQVLDPETLVTRRTLDAEGTPLSLAFVGDQLWTGDHTALRRLDPRTGAALQEIAVPQRANRLVPARGALLVVGPSAVHAVDVTTGRTTATRALPDFGSVTLTLDGDRMWVVHPDDSARAVLQRYDPVTLEPGPPAASPGGASSRAELVGDVLWVTDPSGGRLLCADPETGAVRAERSVRGTGGVVADGTSVVLAQANGMAAVPADCG